MDNSRVIIAALSVLWIITIGLFKYIISIKDKQSDGVAKNIESIKDMVSSLKENISSLNQQVEHNSKATNQLASKIDETNRTLGGIAVNVSALMEWKNAVNRQLEDLYNKFNNITR